MLATGATAETPIKFSLDFRVEGPAAPFLLPLDKGYYKAEGLNVTFDPAAGSLEPISRVAAGTHEMGFGDINTLLKLRDTNPNMPIKIVFMVYNRPPFAVIGRRSHDPGERDADDGEDEGGHVRISRSIAFQPFCSPCRTSAGASEAGRLAERVVGL